MGERVVRLGVGRLSTTAHCLGFLTGHLDDAEGPCLRPLVSFSLGLSAVFLLGGPTKDILPLPLLMRSGDALVMSGPSRLAHHFHLQPQQIERQGGRG